jgi:hypothetical protein
MPITLEEAKKLIIGDILYSNLTGRKWEVSGKIKAWKRKSKVQIPVKFKTISAYITEEDLHMVSKMEKKDNKEIPLLGNVLLSNYVRKNKKLEKKYGKKISIKANKI